MLYSIWGLRSVALKLQNIFFNSFYKKRLGSKVQLYGLPIIALFKGSKVMLGKNTVMISNSYFSEPGVNHPVILRTLNNTASLEIGNNVGMSGCSICVAKRVKIGNNVLIGANAQILDTDFHPVEIKDKRYSREGIKSAEIEIGDNVFIGMNSLILKGSKIGANSVIGAGSIVSGEIPSDCIAAGIPAKVLKNL